MAITPLHEEMTRDVMEEEGFEESARNQAAAADAYVDTAPGSQGSDARYTNQHAMCGFFNTDTGPRLQTKQECQDAVAKLLADLKQKAADAVLSGNWSEGLQLLGSAFHAVQDLAFHNYEPWPYNGIGDACGHDPIYMLGHGVRDLGLVSLDLQRVGKGHVELEVTRRIRLWDVYLTLDGAYHPVQSYTSASPIGTDAGLIEPLGASVMLKITFGGAPHSVPLRSVEDQMRHRSEPDPPVQPFTQALLYGPAARARAEDATKGYLRQLQHMVETSPKVKPDTWPKFLRGGGANPPGTQQGNQR